MPRKPDFSGWATKFNILCGDGRTIRPEAFKDCDGMTVPLVWGHEHDEPSKVLGHALLEYKPEGMYMHGFFNNSSNGKSAKEAVKNRDITHLSIYANRLKHADGTRDVIHGMIREVSLVMAGANPGAVIDNPVLAHSGETCEDEAHIFMDDSDILIHEEPEEKPEEKANEQPSEAKEEQKSEKTVKEVFDSMNEKQKKVCYYLVGKAMEGDSTENASDEEDDTAQHEDAEDDGETIKDIYNSMTEEQKNVCAFMVGQALESKGESAEHSEIQNGGNDTMKKNVFETPEVDTESTSYLSHDEMTAIIKDAKRIGSLKESFLAHADESGDPEYGIRDIEWLFPDFKNTTSAPEWIKRPDDWVSKVMNAVHHIPFSRVRSMFADITEDEARAKGYIKGKFKKEEVFSLLKRTTSPTTVYKKQKLDRDDIVDITDFDVVAWLKTEMRMMLNEELARAYLIGDGRLASDDDKIPEDHIRPIVNDASLFVIRYSVAGATEDLLAKAIIRGAVKARKNYRGSGRPVMFTTEDYLTDMLLLEDANNRRMYKTESELATACRVSEIVTVPVLEGYQDKDGKTVYAIIVNLNDYSVGADKGGAINMFDDFDIDYNAQKYLIETRCSGALVKPFSAIVLRSGDSNASEEPTMTEIRAELNA